MSWKIDIHCDGRRTTLRLIGRMQVHHLEDLRTLIDESGPSVALDLEELALVDLEAVRFLGRCKSDGVPLLGCSQYIREWIAKEQIKTE